MHHDLWPAPDSDLRFRTHVHRLARALSEQSPDVERGEVTQGGTRNSSPARQELDSVQEGTT
ncbi:hypothetical protein GCM10027280_19100 [Micromonospora polyrhachis]